jgi:hypothetical protein
VLSLMIMQMMHRTCCKLKYHLVEISLVPLAMHEEKTRRHKVDDNVQGGIVSAYFLDRETTTCAKVLNNTIKQKIKNFDTIWKKKKKTMEINGHRGYICGIGVHKEASQV